MAAQTHWEIIESRTHTHRVDNSNRLRIPTRAAHRYLPGMAARVPVVITYYKPGTRPPIFVAGTFSDPPWQPQEMEHTAREDGEHDFKKEVYGEPGSKIQYKFRIGDGDWWVLNGDAPTVRDSAGNTNHVLEVKPLKEQVQPHAPGGIAMEEMLMSLDLPKAFPSNLEAIKTRATMPDSRDMATLSPSTSNPPPTPRLATAPAQAPQFSQELLQKWQILPPSSTKRCRGAKHLESIPGVATPVRVYLLYHPKTWRLVQMWQTLLR